MGTDNLPKQPEGKLNKASLFLSASTAKAFSFSDYFRHVCFVVVLFLCLYVVCFFGGGAWDSGLIEAT